MIQKDKGWKICPFWKVAFSSSASWTKWMQYSLFWYKERSRSSTQYWGILTIQTHYPHMELPRGKCLFTVSIRTILVCLVQHLKLCPSHNSSQVDALEGLTVRGQAIALHDMYDGMVLTTMAGYPLTIQLNPFRVNNSSMSMIEEIYISRMESYKSLKIILNQ